MSRVITTVAGMIFVTASLVLSPNHTSAGTAAQRARAMRAALIVDETTTTTEAEPEPATTTTIPAIADAAVTTAPEPLATTAVVPVAPPANITGAGLPGKADNAPLVPGHWTQDTGGAIYRDPSPDTTPTVGATDPAYENELNVKLCAAKPWICGD